MAKLRHIALSVPDVNVARKFFEEAFDMQFVSRRDDIEAFDMAFAAFWERAPSTAPEQPVDLGLVERVVIHQRALHRRPLAVAGVLLPIVVIGGGLPGQSRPTTPPATDRPRGPARRPHRPRRPAPHEGGGPPRAARRALDLSKRRSRVAEALTKADAILQDAKQAGIETTAFEWNIAKARAKADSGETRGAEKLLRRISIRTLDQRRERLLQKVLDNAQARVNYARERGGSVADAEAALRQSSSGISVRPFAYQVLARSASNSTSAASLSPLAPSPGPGRPGPSPGASGWSAPLPVPSKLLAIFWPMAASSPSAS